MDKRLPHSVVGVLTVNARPPHDGRMELTHGSLFSGIGGFDLGFERAGFTTLWQVELDGYCQKVLEKNFLDAKRYTNIRSVHGVLAHPGCEGFAARRIGSGETPMEKVQNNRIASGCTDCLPTPTIITGGFPCQPFSVAGKRRGTADDRYLWPEMLRVIAEVRPRFVVAENVPGIIKLALDQVLSDLEALGYTVGAVTVPACAVDAPHRRERLWIVANAVGRGCGEDGVSRGMEEVRAGTSDQSVPTQESSANVADATQQRTGESGNQASAVKDGSFVDGRGWWLPEPHVGRVAHGVPARVDRLKCLGNAVVPQIAEEIAWMIRRVIEEQP